MELPKYLVANPCHNGFYNEPWVCDYKPFLNFDEDNIVYVYEIVPIKTTEIISDITNHKDYGFGRNLKRW